MNSVFANNGAGTVGAGSVFGGGGLTYGQPQRKELVWTNPLTHEEEKALQGSSSLSLDIPKEDMYRAKCTHRDPASRQFTLRQNGDGTVTCLKCGETFTIVENVPFDQIESIIGGTLDILQTIKLCYLDMTPDVIQTYFIMLPFLKLAPKLYQTAMKTVEAGAPNRLMDVYQSPNMFGNLGAVLGAGVTPGQSYMTPPMNAGMTYGNMMGQVPPAMNPMQQQDPQMMNSVYANGGGYAPNVVSEQNGTVVQPKEGDSVKVSKPFDLS